MQAKANSKERFEKQYQIVLRAEAMGIGVGDRTTKLMDVEMADGKFNLKLDELLNVSDEDFAHDFCGIQANIDRNTVRHSENGFDYENISFNLFLPRFAGE